MRKLAGVLLSFSFAQMAWAGLGQPARSIEQDHASLKGVRQEAVVRAGYSVHEIRRGSLSVREYVGQDGMVFAIGWDGPRAPDLAGLLGESAAEVASVARAQTRGRLRRARARWEGRDVVVERSGHFGALRGRAWNPSRLPTGVDLNEIR